MFSPPNKDLQWTSDDAIALRAFLESQTGSRFLQQLAEAAPVLLDGADQVEKTLVRSGQVKGFSEAVTTIINLTVEAPKYVPEKSAYPDLDRDELWSEPPK